MDILQVALKICNAVYLCNANESEFLNHTQPNLPNSVHLVNMYICTY